MLIGSVCLYVCLFVRLLLGEFEKFDKYVDWFRVFVCLFVCPFVTWRIWKIRQVCWLVPCVCMSVCLSVCYLANLKNSTSMLIGSVYLSVCYFDFWQVCWLVPCVCLSVCLQRSAHNFALILFKLGPYILLGRRTTQFDLERNRSKVEVKDAGLVCPRGLLLFLNVCLRGVRFSENLFNRDLAIGELYYPQ